VFVTSVWCSVLHVQGWPEVVIRYFITGLIVNERHEMIPIMMMRPVVTLMDEWDIW